VVKVLFFTYRLWGMTGWQYPAAMIAYYFISLKVTPGATLSFYTAIGCHGLPFLRELHQ
jgi:hypothetical protein